MHKIQHSALAAGVALLFSGAFSTANAQTAYLDQQASGSGVCAAALPAFEGLVRKRPRAIQNEGDAVAFVSCAPPQFIDSAGDPNLGVEIQLINFNEADATVNCTGVAEAGGDDLVFVLQTATVPADGYTFLHWGEVEDEPAEGFVSISCGLPPGTGIGNIYTYGNLFQLAN